MSPKRDEKGKIELLSQWTMEGWDEQIGCTLQQIHVFLLFIKDIYNCFLPQYIHQSTVLPRDSFSKSSASLPFPFLLNHIWVSFLFFSSSLACLEPELELFEVWEINVRQIIIIANGINFKQPILQRNFIVGLLACFHFGTEQGWWS